MSRELLPIALVCSCSRLVRAQLGSSTPRIYGAGADVLTPAHSTNQQSDAGVIVALIGLVKAAAVQTWQGVVATGTRKLEGAGTLRQCFRVLSVAGFTFLACLQPPISARAQAANGSAQDPAAITLLSRMMVETGWGTLLPSLQDITVVSTDHAPNDAGATITLKARPANNEFRYDIQGGGSIIRTGSRMRIVVGGATTHLPPRLASASYPAYLPFFSPLTSFTTSSVPVHSLGMQTFDEKQVEAVDIGRVGRTRPYEQGPFTPITVYIDPATAFPVGMILDIPAQSNPTLTSRVTWHWSNYQKLSGVLLPTSVQETLYGTVLRDATLESVQLNIGLSDTNF